MTGVHGVIDKIEEENLIVEIRESRTLFVVFTSMGGSGRTEEFEFLSTLRGHGCTFAIFRDTSQCGYFSGIGGAISEYPGFKAYIESLVVTHSLEDIVVIGYSIGGLQALLVGHQLGAKLVLSFSPSTYINILNIIKHRQFDVLRSSVNRRMIFLAYWRSYRYRRYFDARRILSRSNGVTEYIVYHCAKNHFDEIHARRLEGIDGVKVCGITCERHNVIKELLRQKKFAISDLINNIK